MADVIARDLRFHVQRLGSHDDDAPTHAGDTSAPGATSRARPTVVLLHGLVMDNLSSLYFTLANPLAATFDVVLYDLRGHGLSERPSTGYTLRDMVLDLESLLDSLALKQSVFFVGNSFGGLLGLAFAATFPDRARGVALIDGHVGQTGWADRMAATLALEGEERDRQIAVSFQNWLGRHSEKKSNRLARSAAALVHSTSLVADMRSSGALSDADLARVRAPVLALYGETSDLRPEAERTARLLATCELRILPGCTHSVLWEATSLVKEAVITWLTALSGER